MKTPLQVRDPIGHASSNISCSTAQPCEDLLSHLRFWNPLCTRSVAPNYWIDDVPALMLMQWLRDIAGLAGIGRVNPSGWAI